jgi:hypothetical protein
MTSQQLAELLGPYGVIIRTEYHFQIPIQAGQFHDIWRNREGTVKIKMFGNSEVITIKDKQHLLTKLAKYKKSDSELSCLLVLKYEGTPNTIHVDASWKDGHAQIVVIKFLMDGFESRVKRIKTKDVVSAEREAVMLAKEIYGYEETIYTDCQQLESIRNVKWISREKNKAADKLSRI